MNKLEHEAIELTKKIMRNTAMPFWIKRDYWTQDHEIMKDRILREKMQVKNEF